MEQISNSRENNKELKNNKQIMEEILPPYTKLIRNYFSKRLQSKTIKKLARIKLGN